MTNELVKLTPLELWNDEQSLQEIKKIFAPKLNDNEFKAFIGLGKANELNPFLREIWAVKYDEKSPAQIFIGRDGYRKSAQKNPNYDFHQSDAVYENDSFEVVNGEVKHSYKLTNRGQLVGAYCVVQRRSSTKPMYVFVNLKDYDKNQSCWRTLKATMIAKVAEAQCLRMAFQEQFSGSYSEDEEHLVIDAEWSPKQSQQDKMNLLLAKKGINHDESHTSNQNNSNSSNADNHTNDLGLCSTNSNDSPHPNEGTIRTELASNGESKDVTTDTQNVVTKCSEYQLDAIECLIDEKSLDESRKLKALKHFGVKTFKELDSEQAEEMIKILNKIE